MFGCGLANSIGDDRKLNCHGARGEQRNLIALANLIDIHFGKCRTATILPMQNTTSLCDVEKTRFALLPPILSDSSSQSHQFEEEEGSNTHEEFIDASSPLRLPCWSKSTSSFKLLDNVLA